MSPPSLFYEAKSGGKSQRKARIETLHHYLSSGAVTEGAVNKPELLWFTLLIKECALKKTWSLQIIALLKIIVLPSCFSLLLNN